jgi:hypothetical protein
MLPSPLTHSWLRLAVLSSIALPALLAALCAQPATADPVPVASSVAFADEEDKAEAETEDEESEEDEGFEEEEEAEPLPSDECPLRRANAHAVTKHDKLKLTISYTTNEPFNARITIQRGSVQISSVRRHLGHSGVLRFSEKLNERGGKRIVANIAASDRSGGCPSRRLVLFPR